MPRFRACAFTLSDLCVALAVPALIFAGALSNIVTRTRERADRVKCASNLRQIGMAIQMYGVANGGSLPRAVFDGQGGPPFEYSRWQTSNPFGTTAPGPNDVTAALFLLARTQSLTSDVFICPTAPGATPWDYGGRTAASVSNFPGRQFVSYSYQNVYPIPSATAAGFSVTLGPGTARAATFAIAADMNPGGSVITSVTPTSSRPQMAPANSRNHNGDGQNVLYLDGHVEFNNTPFCGPLRPSVGSSAPFRDNIYTYGTSWGSTTGVRGSPVDALDSILLPTALDGPAPAGTAPATFLLRGIVMALAVGVMIAVVMTLPRRRRKPPS